MNYRIFFDKLPIGCMLLEAIAGAASEAEDYRILDVNPAFEMLAVFPGEKIAGRTLLEMLHERPAWFSTLAVVAFDGASRSVAVRFEKIGRTFEIQVFRPEPGLLGAMFQDASEQIGNEGLLRQGAAKYRAIFENIQDVYFETDLRGRLLEISPSVETLLQHSREELIGKPIAGLFQQPAEGERMVRALIESGRTADWEAEILDANRRMLYCSITATLTRAENGEPESICGSLRDITDRKRHELAVEASEARLRQIIDLVPFPIFARDADGVFVLANRALADFHNTAIEGIIGHTLDEIGAIGEEWAPMKDANRRVIETGEGIPLMEATATDGRGRRRIMEITRIPCKLFADRAIVSLGIAIDVTERHEAELGRMRLAMAADQATEAIVITDVDGLIQYVNPAFEAMTGYAREECLGQSIRILKSGKHPPAFYEAMWKTLLRGEPWTGNLINKRKNGSLYEEHARIAPVRDPAGIVANYIAVKRDVSGETEIQNRMRQAQKMEAIGTLAGGIAHDFNNILSAIVGYTELVMSQLPKEGRARTNLEQVLIAGTRAKELIRQILTFSRQVESERRPTQIHLIVKEATKLLRASLPTTIEIREAVNADCGAVLADPTQIHQLVMNLCTNAYQAMMPGGGTLEVGLRPIHIAAEQAASHPELRPGDFLLLAVSDTGPGMEREIVERIFDPFFTTRDKTGGTGLGLATVHGIVAAMDGAIAVYSEPGKGSRFNVYLPALGAGNPVKPGAAPSIPMGSGERILWIDDESAILQFGKEMLERIGYKVETADGSLQGLALFREDPARFDAVITDQTMPKMTGAQLAVALRGVRRDIPIILSTGFSETLSESDIAALGVRAFIEKPFTLSDMARAVRTALRGDLDDR